MAMPDQDIEQVRSLAFRMDPRADQIQPILGQLTEQHEYTRRIGPSPMSGRPGPLGRLSPRRLVAIRKSVVRDREDSSRVSWGTRRNGSRPRISLRRALAGVLLTITTAPLLIAGASTEAVAAEQSVQLACSGQGLQTITRDHAMARANSWLAEKVPYSQKTCYGDFEFVGKSYRQDCSGYVSMAWGLATSLTVRQFPTVATRLSSWSQMQPGDAMLSPDLSHMVLFAGWKDSEHTKFTVWHEANSRRGTVSDASGEWLDGYTAYRSNNITNAPSAESVVNGGGTRMVGSGAYMDVSSTGQVYAWNSAYLGGSPAGFSGRFTDAKVTSGGAGYWLLTSAGQIYAYGNAPYLGGGAPGHTGDIIALAATPDGQGYAMLSVTGQVYAYGNAGYRGGSPRGYSGDFVDLEMTPSGQGYWLLTSTGQIYAYGDATYHGGSPTGFSRAIVAMSPTPDGGGYVMVSKAGQVYAYGNAQYRGGSPTGIDGEISDISHTPGAGYVMIGIHGQHYAYGDAPFLGNPGGTSAVF